MESAEKFGITLCIPAISIGAVKFELPDWLDARDDDGTLAAYPPRTDFANLRISVSTIATEDGRPSLGTGERIVRGIAAKEQKEVHRGDGKVWYSYSQPASEGSPGSIITFWKVGVGAHIVLVSCLLDSGEGDAATKQRVMEAVDPLIRSLTADDKSAQTDF